MNNQPKPTENNFATPDPKSDETRLTGELSLILKRQIGECERMYQDRTNRQIIAWSETEKQKLLKQIWNLSQPDIVPDGWKQETKLGKYLSNELNKSKGGKI